MTAFHFAAGVILVTFMVYCMQAFYIKKVRGVALNNPHLLRGVTPEDALAKANEWEAAQKRLWGLAAIVAGGLVVWGILN